MDRYDSEIEAHMTEFYRSLSEKDRRRYAAIEAEKLGHGGVEYIAQLFDCDAKTIRHGGADVQALPRDDAEDRVRKKGGQEVLS